ncbi:tetratricopeptide repeat protein [Aliidiomarina sanyensis]|uniref:Sel1 repeat family protein n=1 Tax=Aliidiomarina sanyensis TaxID=1249555 RepID=A0A432WG40_9GAMM|nr:tetratricopeptide repeat protein [Aliidiomarina sanyensis]RUO32687.1 hypothetical protein CWE11_07885 [Aliidiomarina sanyensis]
MKKQWIIAGALLSFLSFSASAEIGECEEGICSEVMERLQRSADYGSSEAMIIMAVAYANGEGVAVNTDRARVWMKEAIRFRNPQAYHVKSQWRRVGRIFDQNEERAEYWLSRAINVGYAPAMYERAIRNLQANIDIDASIELLQDAAEEGHPESMYTLARMYEEGALGEVYPFEAAALYMHLAVRNFRDSRERLREYTQTFEASDDAEVQAFARTLREYENMEVIVVRAMQGDSLDILANLSERLQSRYFRTPGTGTRLRRTSPCGQGGLPCNVVFDRDGADTPASTIGELLFGPSGSAPVSRF